MISGTSVTVVRRTMTGRDEMGEPVFSTSQETVGNVLVTPSNTDEMDVSNRMFGVVCELTLHFPKSYTASLEGCTVLLSAPYGDAAPEPTTSSTAADEAAETVVQVVGHAYRILGDPKPYMACNTPTQWNRAAMAVRADG